MATMIDFQRELHSFMESFTDLAREFDGSAGHGVRLEHIINEYSGFITNERNEALWTRLLYEKPATSRRLGAELRQISARCVSMMEKYRAWKLERGEMRIDDYFQNIEACIEKEFGSFRLTSESRVLMVGSGAFPMTPLMIARRTGAEVVGIDIDEDALTLGKNVIHTLGPELNVSFSSSPLDDLAGMDRITHIIFSSTVPEKYEMLHRLHPLTSSEIVVAMRYGDGLKSLFNYPMQEVDERAWRLEGCILQPRDVFDVALYRKAP